MTTIMTKKEAVEKFGSEDCKRHFAKYGKFTNKDLENALIKTLEQHFESVAKVKQGRAFAYELGEERTEIAEREDNRKFNGGQNKTYDNEDFYKEGCKIYMATDMTNGKRYVGSTTKTLSYRISMHKLASKYESYPTYNTPIATAIREHGFENFKWEIIQFWDDKETLQDIEDLWIANTGAYTIGYNAKFNHIKLQN